MLKYEKKVAENPILEAHKKAYRRFNSRVRNKKMTQAELAKRANTKQSNISRFESGNYNPSVEFLRKIAGALDKRLEIKFH